MTSEGGVVIMSPHHLMTADFLKLSQTLETLCRFLLWPEYCPRCFLPVSSFFIWQRVLCLLGCASVFINYRCDTGIYLSVMIITAIVTGCP